MQYFICNYEMLTVDIVKFPYHRNYRIESESFSDLCMVILHLFWSFFTNTGCKLCIVGDLFHVSSFLHYFCNFQLHSKMLADHVNKPRNCGCCCVFSNYDEVKNYISSMLDQCFSLAETLIKCLLSSSALCMITNLSHGFF